MIRVAAVDDERNVLDQFERIALNIKEFEVGGLFESGDELLSYMEDNPLDIVFLDINMPGMNGLQVCKAILNINEKTDVVFVTAHEKYAVEAFELQALDYIMKPLTEERLGKTIHRLNKKKKGRVNDSRPFIQCFGGFQVVVNGEVTPIKNSKAKEILAFLVHKEGVPLDWQKIGSAVWPEYDSEKVQANFHANTYLLRKRLEEIGISNILENQRGNYRIVKESVQCDLFQLKDLLYSNHIRRKEDNHLIDRFLLKGYMEEDGYSWAYPCSAELYCLCKRIKEKPKKNL